MRHNDIFGERVISVYQPCMAERVPEQEAGEFLNIEEDFDGADVLTYKCAKCGEVHKSRRFG